jgi:hypothetical protein
LKKSAGQLQRRDAGQLEAWRIRTSEKADLTICASLSSLPIGKKGAGRRRHKLKNELAESLADRE